MSSSSAGIEIYIFSNCSILVNSKSPRWWDITLDIVKVLMIIYYIFVQFFSLNSITFIRSRFAYRNPERKKKKCQISAKKSFSLAVKTSKTQARTKAHIFFICINYFALYMLGWQRYPLEFSWILQVTLKR